jgi:hypothetical protein
MVFKSWVVAAYVWLPKRSFFIEIQLCSAASVAPSSLFARLPPTCILCIRP